MSEIVKLPASNELVVRQDFAAQLQKKLNNKRLLVALGVTVVGLAVVLPVVIAALQTIFALFVAGGLVLSGAIVWRMIPRWLLTIENRETERVQQEMNRHLAALKAEARANPIEQLQNYLLDKGRLLDAFKRALREMGGQVKTLDDMLRERKEANKQAKRNVDMSKKDASLAAMKAAWEGLRRKAAEGDQAIANLKDVIEDKKFDWKFAQVGQTAMANLRAMSGQDILNEMLAGESFDEVRETFNRVFTDIEVEVGNLNTGKVLTFGSGDDSLTLDLSGIHIETPELVSARAG